MSHDGGYESRNKSRNIPFFFTFDHWPSKIIFSYRIKTSLLAKNCGRFTSDDQFSETFFSHIGQISDTLLKHC